MIKKCKICGKEFEAYGTSEYCPGPHYKKCAVCGKEFEWDRLHPKKCCSRKCAAALRLSTISSETRICELCGKEFHPNNSTQKYCKDDHYRPCPVCGKPIKITEDISITSCCSVECSNELRKRTCIDKYGVPIVSQNDEIRQKLSQASIESENKRKETCIKRYGVEFASKYSEVRRKISNTVKSKECQSRIRNTTQHKYGVPFVMQCEEGLSRYRKTIESKYGVPYFCMTDKCKDSQGKVISTLNKSFGNLLSQNNIPYTFEYKIENRSYDICVPGSKTLIEIDPTYTHNVIGNCWGPGLEINYHIEKTKLANEYGFRCIHIWDWDDWDKIINIIRPKSVIYARKCKISVIDRKTAESFEIDNHLQGAVKGQSICLGLFYCNDLVQVMTFGKPRYNKNYDWELLRLCSISDYAVVGGAEKLWKYFISRHVSDSVISYCDLSKFKGDVYTRLGMSLDFVNEPNKIWSKKSEMITNNLLLQRGYDQLFNTNYGKGTSNEELMLEHGWLPVYDCGQARYTWGSCS